MRNKSDVYKELSVVRCRNCKYCHLNEIKYKDTVKLKFSVTIYKMRNSTDY